MKQFCKFLRKDGECWKTLFLHFSKLFDIKLLRSHLHRTLHTKAVMGPVVSWIHKWKRKESLGILSDVVHNLLKNRKDDNYKKIVESMLTANEAQGCKMSLKVYFLLHIWNTKLWRLQWGACGRVPSRSKDDVKMLPKRNGCKYDAWLLVDAEAR